MIQFVFAMHHYIVSIWSQFPFFLLYYTADGVGESLPFCFFFTESIFALPYVKLIKSLAWCQGHFRPDHLLVYLFFKCHLILNYLSIVHNGPENFKKSRPKKTREIKYINQFHEKSFWQDSIFGDFKNGPKSNLELGNSLKLQKMQFHI